MEKYFGFSNVLTVMVKDVYMELLKIYYSYEKDYIIDFQNLWRTDYGRGSEDCIVLPDSRNGYRIFDLDF